MKIGVMIPTYNRPDLVRRAVLQWIVQTRKPDILCVHQNNSPESYEWAIKDLRHPINIHWIHTQGPVSQHNWYLLPLLRLLIEDCDVFLWADHDDIYFTNHVENSLKDLKGADITLNDTSGILYVKDRAYKVNLSRKFESHAPGGMSSSMMFNRRFATQLAHDLFHDKNHYFSDNVLAYVTMPAFKINKTSDVTTMYVSHKGTHSSSHWPDEEIPDDN